MKMRVADYIAEFVEKLGVRQVFLLSGGGMMHLVDALGRREQLGYICVHHEHAGAVAAEGYARRTGQLGVCYGTSGPGATNLVTGIAECWQDSVPVLFVTGQSKVSQTIQGSKIAGLRQFGTFEVDILPIVQSITKYAGFVDDPRMIRRHLEQAVALATSGRPGPVLLDVPVDVQGALIETDDLVGYTSEEPAAPELAPAVYDDVLARLRTARRPLILAGHGLNAAGAAARFRAVVEALNVPVVTTQLGADVLPFDHPLYVGHPGMKGDRAGNFAIQRADVLLTLGASLHVLTTGYELDRFAPDAYKIQVELDEAILQREQVGVQQKIRSGVAEFLDGLQARLPAAAVATTGWHARCAEWKRDLAVQTEPHAHEGEGINYYDLVDALSDRCAGGETLVADAGSAFYVMGQAFRLKSGQRMLISGAMGAMGHALPMALGASAAAPADRVVCVVGDGSLQTNLQELATLRQHGSNLAMFVVNNDGYVSIRNTQRNFFGGLWVGADPRSGVWFPPLEQVAAVYQLPYLVARTRAELPGVVAQALALTGPVVCEIVTSADQDIIPTVSSFKREDGSMESRPLHDMFPFMEAGARERLMQVD